MGPAVQRNVFVIIGEDPTKSHRPVEALRIALGLVAGDHNVSIALFDQACLLLTEDLDDVVDLDILEKYLPSLKQLGTEFIVTDTDATSLCPSSGFHISSKPVEAIRSRIQTADAVLAFQ